jgi:hypothetical protein
MPASGQALHRAAQASAGGIAEAGRFIVWACGKRAALRLWTKCRASVFIHRSGNPEDWCAGRTILNTEGD